MKILSRVSKRNEEVGSVLESEAGRNSLQVLLEQFQVPISNLGCSISFWREVDWKWFGVPSGLFEQHGWRRQQGQEEVRQEVNNFILAIWKSRQNWCKTWKKNKNLSHQSHCFVKRKELRLREGFNKKNISCGHVCKREGGPLSAKKKCI